MTPSRRPVTRRAVLAGAAAALLGPDLAGCSGRASEPTGDRASTASPAVDPSAPAAAPTVVRPSAPPTPATPGQHHPGPDITHGPRSVDAVALTFHGAGDPVVLRGLLADARAAHARLTVLAVGTWLAGRPSMAGQIIEAGHELGNHTWSHQTMPRLTASRIRVEVERGAEELHRVTGGIGAWFRPSGTPRSTAAIRAAASRAGYGACLAYDVDPLDYTDPGPDVIVRRLSRLVHPGAIVSLHLGHSGTVAAMPRILRMLDQRGLAAVTAGELLAQP